MGAYTARLQSVPWIIAKDIHVRKEAAVAIEPGDFVRLTYQDYQDTIIMRVMSRKVEADRSQEVQFELRADGYYNEVLAYDPDVPPAPDVELIEPAAPAFQRILEVPAGLVSVRHDQNRPQFTALVARGSALDVQYFVYSSDDGTDYEETLNSRFFCVYATLGAPLAATRTLDDGTDGVLLNFPATDGVLDLLTTSEAGRLKSRLLVFIEDEILSYRDVVIISSNQARLVGLRRGCYDSLAAAHTSGIDVAIIRRRDLHIWTDSTYDKGQNVHLKVATATVKAMMDLAEVADTVVTVANRTTRPLPPMNLRINGVGVAPIYTGGGDVLIEWDAASWRRHEFWASWDEGYSDPKLFHRLRILASDGTVNRKVNIAPGLSSYTYAAADLLADFGGSVPSSWTVQVFARRRGARSLRAAEQVVRTSAGPAVNPAAKTNWMYPSLMSQILGACDPETLVDRNFARIASHWSLTLPATATQDEDGAASAVQSNFTVIASARSLTLHPVATSRDPEPAAQANFEIVNAAW